jgi:cardiolipin synthase
MWEILTPFWNWAVVIFAYVVGVAAACHAIMYKRDPRSAAIWVLTNITLPIVGPWLYLVSGINRIERRAVRHLGRRHLPFTIAPGAEEPTANEKVEQAIGHLHVLRTVADRVTRLPLVGDNCLVPLHVKALGRAARRGVKVHALLDGIGALGNFSRVCRALREAGAEVEDFFPLRFPLGRVRVNLRNHRK